MLTSVIYTLYTMVQKHFQGIVNKAFANAFLQNVHHEDKKASVSLLWAASHPQGRGNV